MCREPAHRVGQTPWSASSLSPPSRPGTGRRCGAKARRGGRSSRVGFRPAMRQRQRGGGGLAQAAAPPADPRGSPRPQPPQQDGDPQGCGCAPRSLGHASSSEGRTPAAGRLHPIRRSPGPSDQLSIMHTVHPAPRPGPQRPVSHTHASSLQLHFIRCNILSTGPTPPHLLRLWAQRW